MLDAAADGYKLSSLKLDESLTSICTLASSIRPSLRSVVRDRGALLASGGCERDRSRSVSSSKKGCDQLIAYERQRREETRAPGGMTPTSMTRIAAAA